MTNLMQAPVAARVGRGAPAGTLLVTSLFRSGPDDLGGPDEEGPPPDGVGAPLGGPRDPRGGKRGGDRPCAGRRGDRPLRGRPRARFPPSAVTRGVRCAELTGVDHEHPRALLAGARVPHRRATTSGPSPTSTSRRCACPRPPGPRRRPIPTPPCRWHTSSGRRWRVSPRRSWYPRDLRGRDRPGSLGGGLFFDLPTRRSPPWPSSSSSCGVARWPAVIQRSMALRSHGLGPGKSPVFAVGFADMVGFTLLSQHLSDDELAAVVTPLRGDLPRHRHQLAGPRGQDDR